MHNRCEYYESILPAPFPPNEINKKYYNEKNNKEIDSIYLNKKPYFKRKFIEN
jgi:hypothetical protein